jgi:hypothetical protein
VGQDEQGRRVLELVMGILLELELLVKRQVRGSLNRHQRMAAEEKKQQQVRGSLNRHQLMAPEEKKQQMTKKRNYHPSQELAHLQELVAG